LLLLGRILISGGCCIERFISRYCACVIYRGKAVGGSMELGMTRGVVVTMDPQNNNKNSIMISRSLSQEVKFKPLRNGQTARLVLALVMSTLVMMVAVSRLTLLVVPWSSSSPTEQPLHRVLSNHLNPSVLKQTTAASTGDDTVKNHLSSSTELKLIPKLPVTTRPAQLAESSSSVEKACMSRSQQQMYRGSAHQFPRSVLLDHALEKYTKMHSQCALLLDDGNDTSVQVKKGCQYVVYLEGYEGLGNRLLSLVSAFAYAMVTHRALVIDARRGHLAQLLCEPFHNSSWLLPPQFADAVWGASTLEDAMRWNFQNVTSVRINLRHKQTEADQTFFCPATQKGVGNITWIWWESNQYYVPRLFMIPDFWSLLSSWFPDPSLVFTQLTRFLCLPQNHIWAQIKRIRAAYLASSMIQVGLQVRRHANADNATLVPLVHELIMNCSLKHHVLPKLVLPVMQQQKEQQLALGNQPVAEMSVGSSSSSSSWTTTRSVAVLVTSLHIQYYEKLRNLYVEHGTEDGTVVSVHMMSHEGVENESHEQAVKALTEIWLLSFSNKLTTTSWSTFGYVAQGLGGLQPIILNFFTIDAQHETRPACFLGQSSDPCLHYPFVKPSKCAKVNMSRQHSKWITTHIRPCQDEVNGLQLCSGGN
jgi:xyloglucan fucosyltransferase